MGASIQNIFLCAEEMKIGACWVGEILLHEKDINATLSISMNYQLMAIIAIGYSQNIERLVSTRRECEKNILKWFEKSSKRG